MAFVVAIRRLGNARAHGVLLVLALTCIPYRCAKAVAQDDALDPSVLKAHFKSLVLLDGVASGAFSPVRWTRRDVAFEIHPSFTTDQYDEIYSDVKALAELGANDVSGLDVSVVETPSSSGASGHSDSNDQVALFVIVRNLKESDAGKATADRYLLPTSRSQNVRTVEDPAAYGPGCGLLLNISSGTNKIVASVAYIDLQSLNGDVSYPYKPYSDEAAVLLTCLSREFYGSLGLVKDFGRNTATQTKTAFSNDGNINWYDFAALGILYLDSMSRPMSSADGEVAIDNAIKCYQAHTFGCFEHDN
jgi:hypothetical protein